MKTIEELVEDYGTLCYEEGLTGSDNAKDAANDKKAELLVRYSVIHKECDDLSKANDELEKERVTLRNALLAIQRGDCFCEVAIGNPMMKDHSEACKLAKAALGIEHLTAATPEPR